MKQILIIMILTQVILSDVSLSQVHILQIKVGDKFPEKVSLGGFREFRTKKMIKDDRSFKAYRITYDKPSSRYGNISETIAIFYSKDNIVIGILKLTIRASLEDALTVYIGRLSYFIRTKEIIKNWKLINVRDTGIGGVVDDVYYYTYLNTEDNTYYSVGIFKTTFFEENYVKDSEYEPTLKD